uniref:Uncharacterized protein n=1 Tax=Davidia involucrata TaxID=16924 RepID=A0A5B7BEC9_DAVIN
MATTRLIVPYSPTSLHFRPSRKFQASIFNLICHSAISKHGDGSRFLIGRSLQYLSTQRAQSDRYRKMNFVVYSSIQPGAPLPSGSPPSSWNWILGMVIAMVLPFLRHKWGPLFTLTKQVENAVETAELVTEAIEKVAEEVERVAEEIADDLPEGGKLKNAVVFVEQLAKETAKNAHFADEIIDKVEEMEKEVESLIEPVIDQANEVAKEAAAEKQTSKL